MDTGKPIFGIEANKEYHINEWLLSPEKRRTYLVGVYIYDDFVAFFRMHKQDHCHEYKKRSSNNNRSYMPPYEEKPIEIKFEYRVNHLTPTYGNSGGWVISKDSELAFIPGRKTAQLEKWMFESIPDNSKYDHLYSIMKEKLPPELLGEPLVFSVDCLRFGKPVTKLAHIGIYPHKRSSYMRFVSCTFTLPVGTHNIKVPFCVDGLWSYIIIKELEIFDDLVKLEKDYGVAWQKEWYEHMKMQGIGKKERAIAILREVDSLTRLHSMKRLRLTYLSPKRECTYGFYTTAYLNAFPNSYDITHLSSFAPTVDDNMVDGLYKYSQQIGRIHKDSDTIHEIELIWIEDKEAKGKALFEIDL